MNYPPPPTVGPPEGQPRKGPPALVWVLLGGCGCAIVAVPILAAILFPIFAQAREAARQQSCISNERQMALAVIMYQYDHNQNMPAAASWSTDITPYAKNTFQCPDFPGPGSGYAFDSKLDKLNQSKIASLASTTLLYDSNSTDTNANDPVTSLPDPGRHRGYDNVAFADGHTQSLQPADVPR